MIRAIISCFYNLKISFKIWLCMNTIMLVLVAFIGGLSGQYFTRLFLDDSYQSASSSLMITEQYFSKTYYEMLHNVVGFASSNTFQSIILDSAAGRSENYTNNYNQLQESLSALTGGTSIIDSVLVVGSEDEIYTLYTNGLKQYRFSESFDLDLKQTRGITWNQMRVSPFKRKNKVLPVIFPLRMLFPQNYLMVAEDFDQTVACIILMLNHARIVSDLNQTSSVGNYNMIYLAASDGRELSLDTASFFYETARNPELIELIGQVPQNSSVTQVWSDHQYIVYTRPLAFGNLKLVNVVNKDALNQRLQTTRRFILMVGTTGFLLTTFLSFGLSHFVTRPFKNLMEVIRQIKEDRYDKPYVTKYQDEIGQLNVSINSMYDTIQKQFAQIKHDERVKFRAEIALLAEQINPHFLYNTLECINLEVLNGHTDIAASMIESLGAFLRIGLNYGNDRITVAKEVEHVQAYLTIMNCRFRQPIELDIQVDEDVANHDILKSILQPLVENSIKHGFDRNKCEGILLVPSIGISAGRKDNLLILEVWDNGCGIDIEKARRVIESSDVEHHVGLSNIYQRLCVFYSQVEIQFESIPYFKNRVIILLPYETG